MPSSLTVSVSEFVALLNQTLEYAYPSIVVQGELANFRVSKNRWVYFDLKDETASVRFFGTVYQLPGPLENGMVMAVKGTPRLHPLYGFSVTVQSMVPTGEGSIKKAAALLEAKLKTEGLFDLARKRSLPFPPKSIGLITSAESAAYRDFIKVITARYGGLEIKLIDVQVQGEPASAQIVAAITQFNQMANPPEVLVVTRGGGSAEDLQAFSTEQVTRAVAGSRIPTIVAIGHEVDISLAELAADQRASTPSNAAELLVPSRDAVLKQLALQRQHVAAAAERVMHTAQERLQYTKALLNQAVDARLAQAVDSIGSHRLLLAAYNPELPLARGYALVRQRGTVVRSTKELRGGKVEIQFADGSVHGTLKQEG
ncbi:MAG TPA: exodeoxyribonuclease VII large subunit [Candidatus Saccharimonadales bacterium]|nr:exodeoxyribonuclease VII large subunit [Candidatus Saccharimonadales bacterium]